MPHTELEERLLKSLLRDWGYVVGSAGLRQALGYPTQAALRLAIGRGVLPVKVFQIAGRKGPFALAHDLASWLASAHAGPTLPNPSNPPKGGDTS